MNVKIGLIDVDGHNLPNLPLENTILHGDSLNILKKLPDNSVDCCVTSPPYYHLRDYGIPGQIGMEDTPAQYISNLTAVFNEVRRVLKDTGTLWVNMGDSYNGSRKNGGNSRPLNSKQFTNTGCNTAKPLIIKGMKQKQLIGIPWRFAIEMQAEWILRQDIIWAKPDCMPESAQDRFCKSHEYIFLFVKQGSYYFDYSMAQEKAVSKIYSGTRDYKTKDGYTGLKSQQRGGGSSPPANGKIDCNGTGYRLKRDVWFVPTVSSNTEHYAMFPERLVLPCILCGCPENGIVLDPFMGAGTTAVVAMKNYRKYLGIEINKDYIKIAKRRIANERGLFDNERITGAEE